MTNLWEMLFGRSYGTDARNATDEDLARLADLHANADWARNYAQPGNPPMRNPELENPDAS